MEKGMMVGQLAFAEAKGYALGEAKGYALGEAKGEAKVWAEIVTSMRSNGMNDETIAKITGQTMDRIRSLGSPES